MEFEIREASSNELPAIVALLANDDLGSKRENASLPLEQSYVKAFEKIQADPNNLLIVAAFESRIIACLQLTFIPHITFRGGTRAQIEGVRVHSDFRRKGVGQKLFEWSIAEAKRRDCHLVQLAMNKERTQAAQFYDELGFKATHDGFKLYLD